MGRKITIEIELDSARWPFSGTEPVYPGFWRVTQTSRDGCLPIVAVAHELGHVLANEFQLPRATLDPRVQGKRPNFNTIPSEEEAWDLAEIFFRLHEDREKCLKSYAWLQNVR